MKWSKWSEQESAQRSSRIYNEWKETVESSKTE